MTDKELQEIMNAYESKDFELALRILKPLVHRGEIQALELQGKIADRYNSGDEVKRDCARAVSIYLEIVKIAMEFSIQSVSTYFRRRSEAIKDELLLQSERGDLAALRGYEVFAQTGDPHTLYQLAIIYQGKRQVIFPDLVKSYMYAYLADFCGHEGAGKLVSKISDYSNRKIMIGQIERAQTIAKEFYDEFGRYWSLG